jgi:hypothetical protein
LLVAHGAGLALYTHPWEHDKVGAGVLSI